MRRHPELIHSASEAVDNIRVFEGELKKEPALRNRLGYAHAWYAARMPNGSFRFSFSKIVALKEITGKRYLEVSGGMGAADGRRTERHLAQWFEEVDPNTPLWRELFDALRVFLARWDRIPRSPIRISLLKSDLDNLSREQTAVRQNDDFHARISSNPEVCGGRLCIKGTRMRVSDLVDMLAHGATTEEIVEDFPYITREDVSAALAFAARSVDHRVIRAA